MRLRIHLYIVGIIILTGLIIGSFCDLEIAKSLFSGRNGFGIAISSFGLLVGYGFITFFGAILLRTTLCCNKPKVIRIIFYILSILSIVVASYFSQIEIFSINGLNKQGVGYVILAWAIALVIQSGIFFLVFKLTKNYKNDKFWIVAFIMWLVAILSLLLGTTLLKNIMHRPRYRTVQLEIAGISYHNWWEPFWDYKSYISDIITSEEFKSFPSGHSGTSFLAIGIALILPYIFPMKKKYEIIVFYLAVFYFVLVAFSRMLVGAHFLSDVSMGALLSWVFIYIGIVIINKTKLLYKQ